MTNIPINFEAAETSGKPQAETEAAATAKSPEPETAEPSVPVSDETAEENQVTLTFTSPILTKEMEVSPAQEPVKAEDTSAPPDQPPVVEDKPTSRSSGGLSMEETMQLLVDLAQLQENLTRAESQTQLAKKHVEVVQEQLAKVNEEKSTWQDQMLRQRAEFDNYRKRVEREKQDLLVRTKIDVLAAVLEVLDNLERALTTGRSESGNLEAFLEGVELIQKQLFTTLTSFGLSPVPAVGQAFDPSIHEAVAAEKSDEHEHNTVIGELKRGYTLGDRLVRPAIVKVAQRS